MRYRILGKTGLRVSELALGTMTFGKDWYWHNLGATKAEAKKIFSSYLTAGGNLIDCGNYYAHGEAEKYIGEFSKGIRQKLIISTKFGLSMDHDDPNASGATAKNIYRSLEDSLSRLRTDYIDILWLHMWDEATPIEETQQVVGDLIRAGKVRYFGISDSPAWLIARSHALAEQNNSYAKVSVMQLPYNLIERTAERELLPMAHSLGIPVLAWSPLAGGYLTGKYMDGKQLQRRLSSKDETVFNAKNQAVLTEVLRIANKYNVHPSAVALAWLRQQTSPSLIPVIGAKTGLQFKQNVADLEFRLAQADFKKLTKLSKVELGFPRDFYENDMMKKLLYGKRYWQQNKD